MSENPAAMIQICCSITRQRLYLFKGLVADTRLQQNPAQGRVNGVSSPLYSGERKCSEDTHRYKYHIFFGGELYRLKSIEQFHSQSPSFFAQNSVCLPLLRGRIDHSKGLYILSESRISMSLCFVAVIYKCPSGKSRRTADRLSWS